MFDRILIANRGEIALRVIRTAREMGIETVAVCSDWDQKALHTRMAHVAVPLGGNLPSESYLRVDKILDAAKKTGAQAIHPGYGFLSENANFARAVREAGLVWIGPPPEAIEAMGDKIKSRRRMKEAGVPVVPGLVDPVDDAAAAKVAAKPIGYPIALKAAAGGGGKGIRIVREEAAMDSAFRTASGEAKASFGDGRIYLERYLDRPRHIEVQLLFDHQGNGVHYGVRECSIQRRHQKLLEECPSVVIDDKTREAMGEVALKAGRAVGYQNAGTVEFLWSNGEFFFLEMNTRLQVEHPVTEMVTGRGPCARADPRGLGRGPRVRTGTRALERLGDRDPHQRRGSAQQVPAVDRHHPQLAHAWWAVLAAGLGHVPRHGSGAELRPHARQVDRVGRDARRSDRALFARFAGAQCRRRADFVPCGAGGAARQALPARRF